MFFSSSSFFFSFIKNKDLIFIWKFIIFFIKFIILIKNYIYLLFKIIIFFFFLFYLKKKKESGDPRASLSACHVTWVGMVTGHLEKKAIKEAMKKAKEVVAHSVSYKHYYYGHLYGGVTDFLAPFNYQS